MGQNPENMELEQMREQLTLLRDKLQRQEIVNEKVIMKSVKRGVRSINRRGIVHLLIGIFAIPFCCTIFAQMHFSSDFVLWTGIMLAVCVVATAYAHFGLNTIHISRDNLVKVGIRSLRLRKIYKAWYYIAVPMLLVWGYFLYRELTILVSDTQQLQGLIIAALIGGCIGGAIGIRMHFKTLHEVDEVLEHIHDLMQDEEK